MTEDPITITARELQRGDVICSMRDARAGSGLVSGTSYVQRVTLDGETVTITRAAGAYDIDITFRAGDTLAVFRD